MHPYCHAGASVATLWKIRMEQHRVWLHISGVGLTAGANEAFAPDAHRWIAVAWLITFRLGPKNRRTEVLVSSLRKARIPRLSNDVSTFPDRSWPL